MSDLAPSSTALPVPASQPPGRVSTLTAHVHPGLNRQDAMLQGHSKWITSIAWEPAHLALPSRRFVTGSKDTSIRVWDAVTRQTLFSMSSHTLAVSCVKWGGDGLIYSASKDCTINVWSGAVRLCTARLPKFHRIISGPQPHCKHFLCCCQHPASTMHDDIIQTECASKNMLQDVAEHHGITLRSQDGKMVRTLRGHGHWVNTLALSSEHALRTGPCDHHGHAPADLKAAKQASHISNRLRKTGTSLLLHAKRIHFAALLLAKSPQQIANRLSARSIGVRVSVLTRMWRSGGTREVRQSSGGPPGAAGVGFGRLHYVHVGAIHVQGPHCPHDRPHAAHKSGAPRLAWR